MNSSFYLWRSGESSKLGVKTVVAYTCWRLKESYYVAISRCAFFSLGRTARLYRLSLRPHPRLLKGGSFYIFLPFYLVARRKDTRPVFNGVQNSPNIYRNRKREKKNRETIRKYVYLFKCPASLTREREGMPAPCVIPLSLSPFLYIFLNLIDPAQLSQLDRQRMPKTVVSISVAPLRLYGLIRLSLGTHQDADGMLSRFQNFEWLRPPGESDEWYPAPHLPLHSTLNKKIKANQRETKKKRREYFSLSIAPASFGLRNSLFATKSAWKRNKKALNEPTRMTPLQSRRVILLCVCVYFTPSLPLNGRERKKPCLQIQFSVVSFLKRPASLERRKGREEKKQNSPGQKGIGRKRAGCWPSVSYKAAHRTER